MVLQYVTILVAVATKKERTLAILSSGCFILPKDLLVFPFLHSCLVCIFPLLFNRQIKICCILSMLMVLHLLSSFFSGNILLTLLRFKNSECNFTS